MTKELKKTPMMKCGHAANATTERDGKTIPVCVICIGITPGADEIAETPSLEGRFAQCSYRYKDKPHGLVPSSTELAFFTHKPNEQYDQYYCGCYRWD